MNLKQQNIKKKLYTEKVVESFFFEKKEEKRNCNIPTHKCLKKVVKKNY